jgi:hypothetical protein
MVNVGKTKKLLETKESQCHYMDFYAINNDLITLLELCSTYPKPEQLRCVLYYFVVPFVGLKKGIINYKSINEILTFQKHLEMTQYKIWTKWIE